MDLSTKIRQNELLSVQKNFDTVPCHIAIKLLFGTHTVDMKRKLYT